MARPSPRPPPVTAAILPWSLGGDIDARNQPNRRSISPRERPRAAARRSPRKRTPTRKRSSRRSSRPADHRPHAVEGLVGDQFQKLLALLESRAGNIEAAARHWKRALELRPDDARAAFALARDLERLGGAEHDAEAQRVLDALVSRPGRDNLAARLEFARLAAKRGDASALARAIAPLAQTSSSWPPQAQAQLQSLREIAGDPRAAATRIAFIKNFLVREPEYRRAMSELTTPLEAVGEPIERFLVLKNPEPQPAAADAAMTFTVEDLPRSAGGEASKPVTSAARSRPRPRRVRIGVATRDGAAECGSRGSQLRLPPGRRARGFVRREDSPAGSGRPHDGCHRGDETASDGAARTGARSMGGRHRRRRRPRHRRRARRPASARGASEQR